MTEGISLHIGLNQIDLAHYGTTGKLRGCENDARAMRSIAEMRGYRSTILLTSKATADKVRKEISSAASYLKPKDTFMLTYAGHGSQVPDINNEEEDRLDETWCLYDRMLLDDELYQLWAEFKPGVRIIMVSDSCHSGTVARKYLEQRAAIKSLMEVSAHPLADARDLDEPVYRVLPPANAIQAFQGSYDEYKQIKRSTLGAERSDVGASVLLLAACQDNQTAADGSTNGWFTDRLLAVWNNGRFVGDYKAFHQSITALMPASQSPNYFRAGLANPTFEREAPFTITGKLPVQPTPVTPAECSEASPNQQIPRLEGVSEMRFTTTNIRPPGNALVTIEFAGLMTISPSGANACELGIHRWTYSHLFQATLIVCDPGSPPRPIRLFNGPLLESFMIRLDPDHPAGDFKAFAKAGPFVRDDPNNDPWDYRWAINLGDLHPGAGTNEGARPGGALKTGILYTPKLTRPEVAPWIRQRGSGQVIELYRFSPHLAAAIDPPPGFSVWMDWKEMGVPRHLTLPRLNDPEGTTYIISLMNDPPISYPEEHDELAHFYEILRVGSATIPSHVQWELEFGDRTTDEIPCMPTILEPYPG